MAYRALGESFNIYPSPKILKLWLLNHNLNIDASIIIIAIAAMQ